MKKTKTTQPGLNYLCVMAFLRALPEFVIIETSEADQELAPLYKRLANEVNRHLKSSRKVKAEYNVRAVNKIAILSSRVAWLKQMVDVRILTSFVMLLVEKYRQAIPGNIFSTITEIHDRLDVLDVGDGDQLWAEKAEEAVKVWGEISV